VSDDRRQPRMPRDDHAHRPGAGVAAGISKPGMGAHMIKTKKPPFGEGRLEKRFKLNRLLFNHRFHKAFFELDFDVFADLHDQNIFFNIRHGPVNAAGGADAVAALDGVERFFLLLAFLTLRRDHQKVEQAHDDDKRRERRDHSHGGAGSGSGRSGGGLSVKNISHVSPRMD